MSDDNKPFRHTVESAFPIDLNNIAQSVEAAVYSSTTSMFGTISQLGHLRGGCDQAGSDVADAIIGVMSGTLKALWVSRTRTMPDEEIKASTMRLLSQTLDRVAVEVAQSEAMAEAAGQRPN